MLKKEKITGTQGLQLFQILRFIGILFTGIILAKGGVSSDLIGTYEKIIFISGLVSFFWVSGILNSTLSTYHQIQENQQQNYFFNIACLLCSIGAIVALCMLFVFSNFSFNFSALLMESIPYLIAYVLLNNTAYLNEHILLLKEKITSLVFYGITVTIGSVFVVAVPLITSGDIITSLKGLIILAILKNFYLVHLLRKYSRFEFDTKILKSQLSIALPLVFGLLISGSADYIDGFLISMKYTSRDFAIFRYGAKEFPLVLLLANALSTSMIPKVSQAVRSNSNFDMLKAESSKLMNLLFPISIALLIASPWIYPIVFRSEFIASAPIFNIYILLIISRLIFPQTIVMAFQETGVIFRIALIEISINVVSSYFLMQQFGMEGVAWGTVIAFMSEKLLLSFYLFKYKGISPEAYIPIKKLATFSLLLIFAYVFVENFVLT
jgi:O-antigen/teichoic acid export membrane protein